ncbi:WD40 repeat protein [Dokdonia sp. Hel_I_63]|uniref:OmpA family protein n=1 Tax=unclassified Dokdonia TaxID=2615033 RepID=UPI00020A74AB|nr:MULTISPECIES: OmpA family protein [unclassified Dokdonia]AEE18150.1 OmpA/MotB domain protein [Dokdonia sp. 4H-3-7-5]TVZ22616.1 WD40 repeat protein [Dokdonia sp. Hel_I_63]
MKNIYTLLIILCVSAGAFGQVQKGDRFFNKGDYASAAKYYEVALRKNNSKEILGKLIDAYYLDQDYRSASIYLNQLVGQRFNDEDRTYDNEFNFKMFHVLNTTLDSDQGIDYLDIYYKNKGEDFDKVAAIKLLEDLMKKNPKFDATKSNISSEADDFGPVRVGDSVFFTSDRLNDDVLRTLFARRFKTTQRPFLDIYGVRVNDKNELAGEAVRLKQGVNSPLHDGNLCFNTAGDEMYLSRSAYKNGDSGKMFDEEQTNRVHLYKSVRIDGIWRDAERLSFVNENYSYMHPTLTRDGKRLYFASDMEGGLGGFDIYYVTVQLDGTYSTPVNLGPTINTIHREQFPFVSNTGDLYFSTDGRLGLGLLDIFVAPLTVKGFTEPINLGAPINSKYDDFSLSYYSDNNGLYATNRNGTDDDIYSFVQTGEIITREFKTQFEIRDADTDELISDAAIKILGYQGKEVYADRKEDAAPFQVPLTVDDYTFIASGDNHEEGRMDIQIRGIQTAPYVIKVKRIFTDSELALMKEKNLSKDLKEKDPSRFELLTDVNAPQVVEKEGKLFMDVAPIYFDFDLHVVREDSQAVLDRLAAKLTKYKRIKIKISSHTDSRGPAAYNMPLSEKRAKSTFDYLVSKGIDASRIQYQGYGDTKPVINCPVGKCTEDDHQLNRRSEFEITGY